MKLLLIKVFGRRELLGSLFSALGSVASLIALLFALKPDWHSWGIGQTVLAACFVIFFTILCAIEINEAPFKTSLCNYEHLTTHVHHSLEKHFTGFIHGGFTVEELSEPYPPSLS